MTELAASIETKSYDAPLGRSESFSTRQTDEACSIVTDIFCPHELRPNKASGIKEFQMKHAKFGKSSSLNYLTYGAPVSVVPGEMREVFNVQLQLTGTTKTMCANEQQEICEGKAAILSPTCYVSMDWSEDSSMLIYSVSRRAVETKLEAILGGYLGDPIIFESFMDLKQERPGRLSRQLKYLQVELESADDFMASPLAVEHFEQSLILTLLYSQRHNYSQAMMHGLSPAAPVHVKKVEEYLQANARQPITIEQLTEISGVSARTLFEGFKRFRSTSPMKYLRDIRLNKVHEELLSATPEATVTSIAMKWGFCQLGRFSGEYKAMFGKTPSETMQEARRGTRMIRGTKLH